MATRGSQWHKTEAGKEWRRAYEREQYRGPEGVRRRAVALQRRRARRAWLLVDAARRRAREGALPFDLDDHRDNLQRRIDAGFCEMSGVPFNLDGGRTFDSPSIDRIVPSKGYVYSNVRVVCDLMNRALSNWGEEPVRLVMSAYLTRRSKP